MLPKGPYNSQEHEDEIYQLWEKGGHFKPAKNLDKKPFTIIMPPPNANGSLHAGHAIFVTLEDIMIRYHRMKQEPTLWLPGADHAGFETQVVFEKKLGKEGKSRFDFDNKTLYKMMWNFTVENKKNTYNQLRKLGASCDWSKEKFTLDKDIILEVKKTFKKMYDEGLIYRGERVVNWCVKHQTSLSDLEVEHENEKSNLWFIKYPLVNKKNKFIQVATTRPETMLGDTAVAVNPKDKRYKNLIGEKVELPLTNRQILIIADEEVDPEFGTGAVKVTPAHSAVDFEISERHKLKIISIINKDGKMTKNTAKKYAGLKVKQAREKIIQDLKSQNLLEKIEDYTTPVSKCYKCKTAIEPIILPQWYLSVDSLAKRAIESVKKGEVKFVPQRFEKIFMHWMKNIKPWNISRQIVWGIKIPIKYCECEEIIVDVENKILKCPKCKSKKLIEETDTFDTWFSSGQWPVLTLKTQGLLDKFYPTTVMETAWDILFFWVARMIMFGFYLTNKPPFKFVYLHGIMRDKDRQKLSKSKGNVVDPLGIIKEFGTDAFRMALVFGTGQGNDISFSQEKIIAQKKFANKIWNASKFVILNLQPTHLRPSNTKKSSDLLDYGGQAFSFDNLNPANLIKEDKNILDKLQKTIKQVTKNLDNFMFHEASQEIYDFFWHDFCDKYLESVKSRLNSDNKKDKKLVQNILYKILSTSLKLLHPFMPFITEKIWGELPGKKQMLIIEKWPE